MTYSGTDPSADLNAYISQDSDAALAVQETALGAPVLGVVNDVHAAVADNAGTRTINTVLTNPDVPRTIIATPSGTAGNVTAVSVTVTGTDAADQVLVEVLPPFAAGSLAAVESIGAFKTVTSISQPAIGTGVSVAYGRGRSIGIGHLLKDAARFVRLIVGGVQDPAPVAVTHATILARNIVRGSAPWSGTAVKVDYYL